MKLNTVRSKYTDSVNFFGNATPEELISRYGTPLYVYNEAILRERCKDLMALSDHPGFGVNYAIKANANLALLRIIRSEGLRADALSPGEVHIAMRAGFRSDQILYVCNNVSSHEMLFAIERNIQISVDSLAQVETTFTPASRAGGGRLHLSQEGIGDPRNPPHPVTG